MNNPSPLQTSIKKNIGMVHSFETCGAVDGPGLRFVVFLEGCPLRCAYCCNRDMLDLEDYMHMTPDEVLAEIQKYKAYFGKKGGVTISGGDPMYQPEFVLELLKLLQHEGIHTTLDTSMFAPLQTIQLLMPYTDLFMISLKHFDTKMHEELTMVPNERILENINYLNSQIKKHAHQSPKIWFRYVVLPGYTDTKQNLDALLSFLKDKEFELIELLPYHTLGKHKWDKLGLKYKLEEVKSPSGKSLQLITETIQSAGYTVQ